MKPSNNSVPATEGKTVTPFMTIPEAAKFTGLSKCFLRAGCKDGSIQHVMSGTTYYINIPVLLDSMGVKNWL